MATTASNESERTTTTRNESDRNGLRASDANGERPQKRSVAFTRALHSAARCLAERTKIPFETALENLETALRSTSSPLERYIILTAAEKYGEDVSSSSSRSSLNRKSVKEEEEKEAMYNDTTQKPCGKCGQRRAHVESKQTRGGDEGGTIFVTCICGNRWKYS